MNISLNWFQYGLNHWNVGFTGLNMVLIMECRFARIGVIVFIDWGNCRELGSFTNHEG
ncbi:hypothetical protein A994_09186 [Methanobacterium formicicum DSM 3637]|uniref:Uncharacterized protein n=1 Tax=Methanobacterium formicicum (strain DSM 3637 / PP1) TaxID=1204725 RepID=K2RAJ6_METFP|nr:hypothetical protein A994_09186 [Methanobacterium formicicum DSM 3637]